MILLVNADSEHESYVDAAALVNALHLLKLIMHAALQELMPPHGVGPWPWQECTFMLATIRVCHVQ